MQNNKTGGKMDTSKRIPGWLVAVLALIAVLMLALLAFASPAESQSGFTTPTYGVVRGAPGTSVVVAAQKVPADLVGSECDVVLVGANNESVHPGNDLTVTSAGSSVTFENVENEANSSGNIPGGSLVVGEAVTVRLVFGPDGVSSGGFAVRFDCDEPATTTTTTSVVSTTTTAVPSKVTTTTVAPPLWRPLPPTELIPPLVRQPEYTG